MEMTANVGTTAVDSRLSDPDASLDTGSRSRMSRQISKAERRRQRKQQRARLATALGEDGHGLPFSSVAGRLEIRQTEHKGQGLFALEAIPAATYVMDYEGEVIDEAEKQARYLMAIPRAINTLRLLA